MLKREPPVNRVCVRVRAEYGVYSPHKRTKYHTEAPSWNINSRNTSIVNTGACWMWSRITWKKQITEMEVLKMCLIFLAKRMDTSDQTATKRKSRTRDKTAVQPWWLVSGCSGGSSPIGSWAKFNKSSISPEFSVFKFLPRIVSGEEYLT